MPILSIAPARGQWIIGCSEIHGMAPASSGHLNSFAKGIVIQGHLPADDELFLRPEQGEPYALPYRTMRATICTLAQIQNGLPRHQRHVAGIEARSCLLIGVGKTAPDPIKRGGIHLFALALTGSNGEIINAKTRVPIVSPCAWREFTQAQPEGLKQRRHSTGTQEGQKNADPQSENLRSTQSRSIWASVTEVL